MILFGCNLGIGKYLWRAFWNEIICYSFFFRKSPSLANPRLAPDMDTMALLITSEPSSFLKNHPNQIWGEQYPLPREGEINRPKGHPPG